MPSIKATEVRKGMIILHQGQLHVVAEFEHIAPGNWRAINQIKLKHMKTGSNVLIRMGSSENIERANLDPKACTYLYLDHNQGYVFMDSESYEQYSISEEMMGDKKYYLLENAPCQVTFYEGNPVSVELPPSVTLKVVEAETVARGNTVNGVTKNVKLETGLELKVPAFIENGESVKVSTETGEFQGRSNK